jgi:hypothetical protein
MNLNLGVLTMPPKCHLGDYLFDNDRVGEGIRRIRERGPGALDLE